MSVFKSSDGTKINYEITGSGEPLIMIHGMNGNMRMFEYNKEQLSATYQVITYDVRGHGQSDRPYSYTIDDHIDDCLELLSHLQLKKAHLLGYSMGSYIALGVTSRYPRKVDKLILVGAKAHATVSSFARLMMEHRNEIKNKPKEEVKKILDHHIYYNQEKVRSWQQLVNDYSQLDANEEAAASRSITGFDYRETLNKLPNETLLIAGRYDNLNAPEESQYIAERIPNGRMVLFEHSGHAPLVEESERFAEEIKMFLA
ncbi:alpha/beta hydrolase [Macrococcus hajekii]|uniref:Alpha/beta hydrolase n=1 Tax=Macrococcus hajekii TaxID=198482 RepID=A0A4R6BHV5_9STAP|nr:alpha/beta hydrolase [Macrococcus hajekii]TDM01178.1 alpha/beta hydrolase [Macrococcus hajekii]GGB11915.1 lysophospholipase [Macrococcus hajekii]